MLAQQPTDPDTVADPMPGGTSVVDAMQTLNDLLASPEFQSFDSFEATSPLLESTASTSAPPSFADVQVFDVDAYLTSPLETPYDDFGTSPAEDSPFSDFLTTPVLPSNDEDMLTGPLIEDVGYNDGSMDLFGGVTALPTFEVTSTSKLPATTDLYTISPATPAFDSVDPTTTVFPRKPKSTAAPPADEPSRRRSSATGTRKNLKPDALIPLDAPTQKRTYAIPSATSRKAVPAVFAQKKRLHSVAFEEEGEEALPTASEKEAIEHKRRQNTLAARKSRKRKLEHQQLLETELSNVSADRDRWRTRALMAQEMLRVNGIPCSFDD